jgi:hypothetical protein
VLGGPGQQTTAGIWRVSAGVCSCWKAMCSQSLHLSVRTCRPRESTSQKERALSPTENNNKKIRNVSLFTIYANQDRVMRQEEGNYITIRWYRPAENAFYRPIHRKFLTEKRENPRKNRNDKSHCMSRGEDSPGVPAGSSASGSCCSDSSCSTLVVAHRTKNEELNAVRLRWTEW